MECANTGMHYIVRIWNNSLNVESDSNRHYVAAQKRQLALVPIILSLTFFVQLGYSALVGLGVSSTTNLN